MKNSLLKLIILCGIFIFSACENQNGVDKPEEIGKQVFSIIQKLQIETKNDYLSNFLELKKLKESLNKETAKAENEITSLTKKEYYSYIEKEYDKIKEDAIDEGIEFEKATYLDFKHKKQKGNELSVYDGILYFKYNEEVYQIRSISIDTGKKYELFLIYNLKEK